MAAVSRMGTTGFVVLVAAVAAAGLSAGLVYAFSVAVMPGLARVDDRSFVEAMRGINVAIVNGWFLLTFLGAPLLAGVAAVLHRSGGAPLWWSVAGFVLLVAVIVQTRVVHIPMNDALDAGRDGYAELRARFETSWVRWNLLRTAFAMAGFGCLVAALVSRARA
jgi:uncharacterized membrane protein